MWLCSDSETGTDGPHLNAEEAAQHACVRDIILRFRRKTAQHEAEGEVTDRCVTLNGLASSTQHYQKQIFPLPQFYLDTPLSLFQIRLELGLLYVK